MENIGAFTHGFEQDPHYMWQSRVEVEGYSVVYFDRIAVFEEAYCCTSIKGRAHMCLVDA